jgi:ABC-type multidrug transport system permease subunit
MAKLISIIRKNFKILIRSKSSALIILVGPLLLILLVGSAFNTTSFSNINIGTYSESYNDLSNSIILKLEDDSYVITKLEDKETCVEGVKTGATHLCAIFPGNLDVKTQEEIELYVDQSRINLVFAIKSAITRNVAEKSDELSKDLTGIIVSQISQTGTELKAKRDQLLNIQNLNSNVRTEIDSLQSSIVGLNINLSELSLIANELENETNEIKTELNESSEFKTLDNTITALKAEIKNFDSLVAEKNELANKASAIKSSVDTAGNEVQQVKDSTDSIITRIEAIEVTDIDSIVSPIKTVTKPINKENKHINFLFPTLIMMVVMFVSILLSSITVIREKISAAYFRNYISPTSNVIFILATYLTNILIVIMQLVIVFGVMMVFNPELSSTLFNASAALLLITTTFILLGMIVGYVFSSEETATIGSISLGTILLFFSNTIVPLETLPTTFRGLANYNIFVVGESILRKIILFESSLKGIANELYILIGYIIVFILIITILYRASSEIYNIKKHLKGN